MSNNERLQTKGSENFGGRFGALMSMIGMCVGLGNVWRFPYLCAQDGGGVFVVAYLICMILVVIPLAIIECGYGKGIRGGVMNAYEKALKSKIAGRILGGLSAIFYGSMNFFFYPVMAAAVYMLYVCVTAKWETMPAEQIYSHAQSNTGLMIGIGVVICILVGYFVARGVGGGVEAVSKIFIPLMFVAFVVVVVICLFSVDGIAKGYEYYLHPDWSRMTHLGLWVDAMGQALFSVGVGPGVIFVYGSHLKDSDDISLNMLTTAIGDSFAALVAGMAVIPTCIAMGIDPESGSGLIFIVLPKVLSMLPAGRIIGIILFLGIFFAAFTTAIAQFEMPVVTFFEGFKVSRKKVAIIGTVISMIGGIACTMNEGVLNFFSNLAGNYGFIITAALGAIVFSWVYGAHNIMKDFVNPTSDFKLGSWFNKWVMIIAVPIMLFIMFNSLVPVLAGNTPALPENVSSTLSGSTIVMLIVVVGGVFGGAIALMIKSVTTKHD